MITLLQISCNKEDDIYSPGNSQGTPISDIIKITNVSRLTIEADTLTVSVIEVEIHPEASEDNRKIAFSTSLGNFQNGKNTDTITVNASGKATISLLSGVTGIALVSAKVSSYSVDTTITFTTSLPDDMLIEASKYVIDSSETITITSQLFRNPGRGKVSDPVKIYYDIIPDGGGVSPLIYPSFAFSKNREALVKISNPLNWKGRYQVVSKTISAQSPSDTIQRSLFIQIK